MSIVEYLDEEIIILNKPRGIPSLPLRAEEEGTLAGSLLDKFPELAFIGNNALEAGLVQRLDNDTSGLLIAARKRECWLALREQFRKKQVQKEYLALVLGRSISIPLIAVPSAAKGRSIMNLYSSPKRSLGRVKESDRIASYIAHSKKSKKKMIVVAAKEARQYKARRAVSLYEPIKEYNNYTLVKLSTSTGLRHQVRVQLSWLGYPLAGDKLYQNRKQRDKDVLPLTGHFLHAAKISFSHPKTHKRITFEKPLPQELKQILSTL